MASASTHRCSVLVVDDDAEVRDLLRVALSADGYHVAAVSNGRDALHHLRSQAETCIIVLDLILPVMDGAQFRTAQLRDRSLSWIPVVVMSAWDVLDGVETQIQGVVRKPVDMERLLAFVTKFC